MPASFFVLPALLRETWLRLFLFPVPVDDRLECRRCWPSPDELGAAVKRQLIADQSAIGWLYTACKQSNWRAAVLPLPAVLAST